MNSIDATTDWRTSFMTFPQPPNDKPGYMTQYSFNSSVSWRNPKSTQPMLMIYMSRNVDKRFSDYYYNPGKR